MTLYTKTRRSSKHLRNKYRTRVMKGGKGSKGSKTRVKYKNRAIYEGDFKDGKENGYGTTTWTDGAVYVGKFKNGLWHGQGKMKWANGEVYEGSFMNGLRHGKGKTTYPNGEIYEGDYKDDMKNGKGMYQWADGSVYVGEWLDDNINGRGKWRDENGVVYEGNLKEGGINSLSLLLQDGNVSNIVFHPTEPLLLAACRGKTHREPQTLFLQRFNRNTGHIIDVIPIDNIDYAIVKSIAFHPTEPIFAVGNIEDNVELFSWKINKDSGVGLSFRKITSHINTQCEIIMFHPRGPLFATYGKTEDNIYIIKIWQIERATADAAFPFVLTDIQVSIIETVAISCIAFHPTQPIMIMSSDTTRLVNQHTKTRENYVIIWKYDVVPATTMVVLSSISDYALNSDHRSYHRDDVNFVAFHPTKPFFATASKDATIKMWRMTPNPDDSLYATCVATFRSDDNACPVTCVAFHPTAPLLVGGFHNGNAVVWEYMGLISNKVLDLEPVVYKPHVVSVYPLPPPVPHRMRMTPAMLTEAKGKLRRRSDTERNVAMMKKSPRVPFSTSGVKEDSDSSPSPPPRKSLSRAELNRREREREERQRELVDSSHVFVSAVNFQVDSRGVSFLEIGRNNTKVVELRNVSDLVSEAKIKESVQKEQFSSRKEAVEKFADMFKLSTRPNRRQFTAKEVHDAILRQPVRLMGVSPKVEEDEDWKETLKMREGSKGGYKSRHKNVTRRLRKSRR